MSLVHLYPILILKLPLNLIWKLIGLNSELNKVFKNELIWRMKCEQEFKVLIDPLVIKMVGWRYYYFLQSENIYGKLFIRGRKIEQLVHVKHFCKIYEDIYLILANGVLYVARDLMNIVPFAELDVADDEIKKLQQEIVESVVEIQNRRIITSNRSYQLFIEYNRRLDRYILEKIEEFPENDDIIVKQHSKDPIIKHWHSFCGYCRSVTLTRSGVLTVYFPNNKHILTGIINFIADFNGFGLLDNKGQFHYYIYDNNELVEETKKADKNKRFLKFDNGVLYGTDKQIYAYYSHTYEGLELINSVTPAPIRHLEWTSERSTQWIILIDGKGYLNNKHLVNSQLAYDMLIQYDGKFIIANNYHQPTFMIMDGHFG